MAADAQLHIFMTSSDAGISPVTVDAFTVALIVNRLGSIVVISVPVGVAVVVMKVAGSSVPTVDQPTVVVGSSVVTSVNVCKRDEVEISEIRRNRVLNTTPNRTKNITRSR